ncbi:hypothetical protein BU24DRAFT_449662 [Aaosphaeria arxii CBS 175.79]|uniref:Uncharacterized protein n=1 Tax=Aaosphaeria arxii CBS 175.79 TaxID=1450172 RepID=A0A6A5XZW3_9PLEO|nr:uncharacterized protein BU24DRAFT_449662 [Aaosphaeria arxii CBS 175.79]KAF2018140.1 hypothetical protein BU24DRAFT_449662 [Aaosphaeria arxii CBS 175.79]
MEFSATRARERKVPANDPATGLVKQTTATLQEIAQYLTTQKTHREVRAFGYHLLAYCHIVIDYAQQLEAAPENTLAHTILQFYESLVTTTVDWSSLGLENSNCYPRIQALHRWWGRTPQDLHEWPKYINVEARIDTSAFLKSLDEWETVIKNKSLDYNSSTKYGQRNKISKSFVLEIPKAATSLFQTLSTTVNATCKCHKSKDFNARIGLSTHRKSLSDDGPDFDMFWSFGNVEQSKLEKWLEAHVQVSELPVYSPKTHEPTVRFQLPSVKTSAHIERCPSNYKRTKTICAPMSIRNKATSKCLEMTLEEDSLLWKFPPTKRRKNFDRFDDRKPAVTLRDIIANNTESLSRKSIGIISILISYSVLHFSDTPWLQQNWDSRDVLFFYTSSKAVPIKPYLQVRLTENPSNGSSHSSDTDIIIEDNFDDDLTSHPFPIAVSLAIVLLELYLGKPFPTLTHQYDAEWRDEGMLNNWMTAASLFDNYEAGNQDKVSENPGFHHAIKQCLNQAFWLDDTGKRYTDTKLREMIYRHIILPLEEEFSKAFAYVKVEELDAYAWDVDLKYGHEISDSHICSNIVHCICKAQNTASACLMSCRNDFGEIRLEMGARRTVIPGQIKSSKVSHSGGVFHDDTTPDEGCTELQCTGYAAWKNEFENVYFEFITRPMSKSFVPPPVKIAILDTGADRYHPKLRTGNIQDCRNFVPGQDINDISDNSGHGTHITGIFIDYVQHAEIYMAKISGDDKLDPRVIAQAIKYAVDEWEVDVISMSLGFSMRVDGYEDLECAIKYADDSALIFAAASNGGGNTTRDYPARDKHAFCIHSTNAYGNRSDFSPTALENACNFATIGEAVRSAWPESLYTHTGKMWDRTFELHKSGTSFATPIAASIVAFILLFAKLHLQDDDVESLKRHSTMESILLEISAPKRGVKKRDEYDYLHLSRHPHNFFSLNEDVESIKSRIRAIIRSSG